MNTWYQKVEVDGKYTTNNGYMSSDYFKEILPLFPPVANKFILDLCCNAGLVSFELAKLGATVTGIEKDLTYYGQAIWLKRKLKANNVTFITSDVEDFNFSNHQIDIIVALSCLYHLKNPKQFIERLISLNVPIISSFRLSNFEQFMAIFANYGLAPAQIRPYARKIAVRFN